MDFGFCEDSNEFVEKDPTVYARSDEILGGAAFKTVYRAADGVEVAWKQVNVEHVSPEQLERLISEARLLISLKDEYIIKFYDFWIDNEKKNLNFITEIFVSGSLSQYCKKHKGVTTRAIKNWARQILRGLHYLHTREPPIIHGYLIYDNIFVNGNNGEVKIGNLGLAIGMQQPADLSDLVTPAYMAPSAFECKNPGQTDNKVISGMKPASLDKVKDPQVKQFIEECLVPASLILSAIELLNDPFLATENSKDNVSDTAVSVAEEMAVQLELSPEDEAYNAELIDTMGMKLVPSWKTSCGSIARTHEDNGGRNRKFHKEDDFMMIRQLLYGQVCREGYQIAVLYWSTLIRYNGELDCAALLTAGGSRTVLKKVVSGYCLLINSQGHFRMIFSFPAGILKSDDAKMKQLKNQPYVGKLEIESDPLKLKAAM
ncbi:hypothetical protein SADUNF_Sadunf06G0188400 [Salix dunnii]|uniref:non-specific serine/threonine protein kinase n=1 Tax=Salix dunnii TaxID=1413687 RepID=A0A835MXN6_9ROSI|nr:hypothetical protein SADUNF_Sadunf06G0188400 [Salix dunnii]